MITLYNETQTPWILSNVGENCKISTSKSFNEKGRTTTRTIGLHIAGNPEIDGDLIRELVNMDQPEVILNGVTNILFQQKDCSPFVTTAHKYNKDILCVNINLRGAIVTNINTNNIFILGNYTFRGGELGLIIAVSDKATENPCITLYNQEEKKYIDYIFTKVDNKYTLSIKFEDVGEDITVQPYKIKRFRPAKPTNLIYVFAKDVTTFNELSVIKNSRPNMYNIIIVNDLNDLKNNINTKNNEGYKAATLFANVDNIKGQDFDEYDDSFTLMKDKYRVFNLLLNNERVIKF